MLRLVNSRAFASSLGPTLPDGAFVTSLDAACTLLERALASELQGEVSLEYAPAGVRCTIVAPLEVGQQLVGNPST